MELVRRFGGYTLTLTFVESERHEVSLDDGLEDRCYPEGYPLEEAVAHALHACDVMAAERDRARDRASKLEEEVVRLTIENARLRDALRLPIEEAAPIAQEGEG